MMIYVSKQKQIKKYTRLFLLFLPLLAITLLVWQKDRVQNLFTQATGTPANIVIDTGLPTQPLNRVWDAFAQGGESSTDMIAPVVGEMKNLKPSFIRIDHIYDHYNVVDRNADGSLRFDFNLLDAQVKSIVATGAIPYLSLSYMPSVIAENGDIIGKPVSWNEWALVVQRTIEHYSGKGGFNLENVHYEVWNEPDLFGGWKPYGAKNYLTLYTYASIGAKNAQNTNAFKLGGPSTTKLYKNWIDAMRNLVQTQNVRLDFWSWHLYTKDPKNFAKDAKNITKWLFDYPNLVGLPRHITEWGYDSDLNAGLDGNVAAAHTVATIKNVLNGYEKLFAFEIVDGLSPEGKLYWGRWGMITHPSLGKKLKPRYFAFSLLNKLGDERMVSSGEGSWVSVISAKKGDTYQALLVNYDAYGKHSEQVPVTFQHLPDDTYTRMLTYMGKEATGSAVEVMNNTYTTEIIMTPNSIALLELTLPPNPFLNPITN